MQKSNLAPDPSNVYIFWGLHEPMLPEECPCAVPVHEVDLNAHMHTNPETQSQSLPSGTDYVTVS